VGGRGPRRRIRLELRRWDGYDTHYTERYMRRPQDNPAGYREGSVIEHVGKLRGKLLLVHGMVDENVHFRHTTRLIQALSKAGRPYDLLAFPEERHFPRAEKDRRDMEERIVEYFRLHL
jgi:dipeptidyl-peptidase-4